MIDAGVGHGPVDFAGVQIRVVPRVQSTEGLWETPPAIDRVSKLLATKAYELLETSVGECGTFTMAEASVAVPFVGAATGALALSQLIRLASLYSAPQLLQVELSAPEMETVSTLVPSPSTNLGSEHFQLGPKAA